MNKMAAPQELRAELLGCEAEASMAVASTCTGSRDKGWMSVAEDPEDHPFLLGLNSIQKQS